MAGIEEMLIKLERRIENLEIVVGIVPEQGDCIVSKVYKIEEAISKKIDK